MYIWQSLHILSHSHIFYVFYCLVIVLFWPVNSKSIYRNFITLRNHTQICVTFEMLGCETGCVNSVDRINAVKQFHIPSFNFPWFRSLFLLSIRITTILSSLVFIKLSTATLSKKIDLVEYSLSIFYVWTLFFNCLVFIPKMLGMKKFQPNEYYQWEYSSVREKKAALL